MTIHLFIMQLLLNLYMYVVQYFYVKKEGVNCFHLQIYMLLPVS